MSKPSDTVPRKKLKRRHDELETQYTLDKQTLETQDGSSTSNAHVISRTHSSSTRPTRRTTLHHSDTRHERILRSNHRKRRILHESNHPSSANKPYATKETDTDATCGESVPCRKKRKITHHTVTRPIIYNEWTPWSKATKEIPYEKTNGIGPGEYRVASILHTTPLGQNKPYDLDLDIEGLHPHGEIKETDAANSFKTGRDGRNAWRPIHLQVVLLQEVLRNIIAHYHENDAEIILKMSPDEICEGNIHRITRLCTVLHHHKLETAAQIRQYTIYDMLTGTPITVDGVTVYSLFLQLNTPVNVMKEHMKDDYDRAHLVYTLQHPYIDDPQLFTQQLHSLTVTLFQDVTVILVNPKKGYCIITEPEAHLRCNRITLGVPRFKVA